jgi:hypothetical protein
MTNQDRKFQIVWATHPRHLPEAPSGHVVVLDVAFAAGAQYKLRTLPLIDELGERLHYWIDHHLHPEAWERFSNDSRFLLVPNHIAHACPELITEDMVEAASPEIDTIIAHCDFDGALSAVKWILRGKEPWPHADEDARAIDSPGRGHTLTDKGAHIAFAMDEIHGATNPQNRLKYMTELVWAMVDDRWPEEFKLRIDELAKRARKKAEDSKTLVAEYGNYEASDIYVIRLDHKVDNQERKNILVAAEMKAKVGVLIEHYPDGGYWITVATFDTGIDLAKIKGLTGGRSDYRFARAKKGGRAQIEQIQNHINQLP